MSLRRKVSPSMRGISMSRVMTSGTSLLIFSTATSGSTTAAMTSMSGSDARSWARVWRTTAESSMMSTRMGFRMRASGRQVLRYTVGATWTRGRSMPVRLSEWPMNKYPPGINLPQKRLNSSSWVPRSK